MQNAKSCCRCFFPCLLRVSGAASLLLGIGFFLLFVLAALPKLSFLSDGMLNLPLLVLTALICLVFCFLGLILLGLGSVLSAVNAQSAPTANCCGDRED